MSFYNIFSLIINKFNESKIKYALIGDISMGYWNVGRNTLDIDFLISLESLNDGKSIIDILIAHRKYTNIMLSRAVKKKSQDFEVKVLIPEDIIGLKLQAMVNDDSRKLQDMADIEMLIKRNTNIIDWNKITEYFEIFDKINELDYLRSNLVAK